MSGSRRFAAALFVAVVLAGGPSDLAAQTRRELRVGVAGLPAAIDPASAIEGTVPLVARQIYDTLVRYRDGSTDVEPALATRWTVSRDGLVWSFTLRDGVRFQDGSALAATDVAQSFARQLVSAAQDPQAAASPWAALLHGLPGVVKEVRAADTRTVQFVLARPYAPLLTVLAHPAFSVVRTVTGADGTARLIGTGPYRVVDASAGRLALEAVPGAWSGPPRTDRLVFLDVPTDDQAEAAFDSGALDLWFPPGVPRRAAGALSTPGLHVGYLALETEKEPFTRKKIRQALAAAIDPAALGAALGGAAVPLQSFLPPGVWARREGSPILGGTREGVKRLLAEGQWPKSAAPTLLVPDERAPVDLPKVAEVLQASLGAAGIAVKLRVDSPQAVRAGREAGAHDLLLTEALVGGGDPHLFLYPLCASEGATKGPSAVNFSFYRDGRLDDVLTRASQLAFRPERQRLYQRAQAVLADELPWLPIYVRLVWAVARPEVRGLRLQPTGFHRLDTVWLEVGAGSTR